MCKLCETNPVYEFTNKRKLCKKCFINYFQKKVLYTIRKFKMINRGDVVEYKKDNNFRGVVLGEILKFIADKMEINLNSGKKGKIASASSIDSEADNIVRTLINRNVSELKKFLPVFKNEIKPLYLFLDEEILLYAKLKNFKFRKMGTTCGFFTTPATQQKVDKKNIKQINNFLNEFEKKNPEVKRAIVNSILELYE